tara:strand:+ start:4934 stop:5863 length:930 start_codon:yes stop_codon:yes gene_type:complete
MNIHENNGNSNRSKATCGYCRETGHNQYQCPHVKGDWENFLSRLEIPKDKDGNLIRRGYNYAMYSGFDKFDPLVHDIANNALASWFRNCKKAYLVQKERGFNLGHKVKRGGGDRNCGFCGQSGHTRRNCTKMDKFLKDCYKANENWRMAAYKELVLDGGLSVGACLQVTYKTGHWNNEKTHYSTAIITKINWDTINVFSGMSKYCDDVHSPVIVEVLVDGERRTLDNLHAKFNTIGENGKSHTGWRANPACSLISVITNSPTPLPQEWITSYKESFGTLVKKRTYEQLQNGMKSSWRAPNLVAHVSAWK